jgi:hypothetical protein
MVPLLHSHGATGPNCRNKTIIHSTSAIGIIDASRPLGNTISCTSTGSLLSHLGTQKTIRCKQSASEGQHHQEAHMLPPIVIELHWDSVQPLWFPSFASVVDRNDVQHWEPGPDHLLSAAHPTVRIWFRETPRCVSEKKTWRSELTFQASLCWN